jgi:serpin B
LGVNKIFDISKADFSNFTSNSDSFINDILHKVEIIIDEIGTIASAATTVIISRGGQPPFNVNRPFIYFIHHVESDTIIFWSTVYKPTPYTITPPLPLPNSYRYRKH